MKTHKINPTLAILLMPGIYTVLVIGLAISFYYAFRNFYFTTIYVDGNSMNPTLVGNPNDADYGLVDKHDAAKKALKRYQIVTATYPWQSDDLVVIKRVLILPNETFRINMDGKFSIEIYKNDQKAWVSLDVPFERNLNNVTKYYPETTLGPDEYIVAGDNWEAGNSYDCLSVHQPITYKNIVGVVTKMLGRCHFDSSNHTISDKRPYATRYFFGVDY